jgi:hypothetical protein
MMDGRPRFPNPAPGTPARPPLQGAPAPGQQALVMALLLIGVMFMGIQLWVLTVALELYLSGEGARVWWLALVSGGIFLGGLFVLRLLGRRPRVGG